MLYPWVGLGKSQYFKQMRRNDAMAGIKKMLRKITFKLSKKLKQKERENCASLYSFLDKDIADFC